MEENKPVLILQMQRMGDLVLTFPLIGWLVAMFPGHPVWVVAEEAFFKGLMPLSPDAVFFPYDSASMLKRRDYALIINLSHRPEAAALAGSLRCERRLGQYRAENGATYIAGDWQLYRHSFVRNNRYNLYHWSDLNGLDLVSPRQLKRTLWTSPSADGPGKASGGRIGLFLGASETEKRPELSFWAELAQKLMARGHKPVFLGGEAEREMGQALSRQLRSPSLNLCGRFSVSELARFIAELDLLVTPDTGPMHIAAWVGTQVLNLSLGPVNMWETGPCTPGHYILRPALSCTGCWQCRYSAPLCRDSLNPGRVAFIAGAILNRNVEGLASLDLPGQELWLSGRDANGLYDLIPLGAQEKDRGRQARLALSRFWQAFFGVRFQRLPSSTLESGRKQLLERHPETAGHLLKAGSSLLLEMLKANKNNGFDAGAAKLFADAQGPLSPLLGYLGLYLQNNEYSAEARARSLEWCESLRNCLTI